MWNELRTLIGCVAFALGMMSAGANAAPAVPPKDEPPRESPKKNDAPEENPSQPDPLQMIENQIIQEILKAMPNLDPNQLNDIIAEVSRQLRQQFPNGLPPRAMPVPGGAPQVQVQQSATTISRIGDRITIDSKSGDAKYQIRGKVDGKKTAVEEIVIEESKDGKNGKETVKNTYTELKKVPEEHRDKVEKLIKMCEGNPLCPICPACDQ